MRRIYWRAKKRNNRLKISNNKVISQIPCRKNARRYSFEALYTTNEQSFLATEFSLVRFYHERRKFLCTWGRLVMVVGDRLWATYHATRFESNIIARYTERMSMSRCCAHWLSKSTIIVIPSWFTRKESHCNYGCNENWRDVKQLSH